MAFLLYKDQTKGWTYLGLGPQGPQGPAGPKGPIAVSGDANNAATLGSDGLIYVPQTGGSTGNIVMYAGSTAPEGWHLCDGTVHGSAALAAIIGSPNTPDLRDKFVRGWGTAAIGSSGGADTVTLTVANMPSHNHGGATQPQSVDHYHGATTVGMSANAAHSHTGATGWVSADHAHWVPDHGTHGQNAQHEHNVFVNEGSGESADGNYADTNPDSQGYQRHVGNTDGANRDHAHTAPGFWSHGISANHYHDVWTHAVNVDHTHALNTGGASVNHTHAVNAEGAGAPVSILPSFIVLSYIIKL